MVNLNPEAAGMVRTEQRGWALLLAAFGTFLVLVSFVLPWITIWVSDSDLNSTDESVSPLFVISKVDDLISTAPDYEEPHTAVAMYFQWGMLLVSLIAIVLAVAAARGLRRRSLTTLARVAGAVVAAIAVFATYWAVYFITFDSGSALDSEVEASRAAGGLAGSDLDASFGPWVWYVGVILLFLAAAIGPRIVFQPPPGATGQLASPAQLGGFPGAAASAPHMPMMGQGLGQGMGQPGQMMRRVRLPALILMPVGAVLAFASYTFLPWNSGGPKTVLFSDLSGAAHDGAFKGHFGAEIYFGFLGWLVLLISVVAAGVVFLGRKPIVRPQVLRPVLSVTMVVCLIIHFVGVAELDNYGTSVYALFLGLGLSAVGALLPLETKVGWVQTSPPPPPQHQGPPAPPPAPPGWSS